MYLLKICNASRELITLVLLMLSKSDTATGAMILLLQDVQPETEDHILRIAMGLVEMLPPEERTGEVMNLRIKLQLWNEIE